MGATCRTCTGIIEPNLNRRYRNVDTTLCGGEGSLKDNTNIKSSFVEEENRFELSNLDSSFLQDLSRFIRTLPAKSKQHIWSHAVRKKC